MKSSKVIHAKIITHTVHVIEFLLISICTGTERTLKACACTLSGTAWV